MDSQISALAGWHFEENGRVGHGKNRPARPGHNSSFTMRAVRITQIQVDVTEEDHEIRYRLRGSKISADDCHVSAFSIALFETTGMCRSRCNTSHCWREIVE